MVNLIYDKSGYVLLEAILFLWMVTFFMTLLISIVQSYPDEKSVYDDMIDNQHFEEVFYE